jgi:NAD(P)-dependent dehydrogenase (short-subunit alcohol dehydrogenase family)
MARLAGKVAIVTGASAGIGAETAKRFAQEGAKVVVVARTVARAQTVVDQIKANGGEALAVACDIESEDQIKAMVEETIVTYGRIDVLDNNAALTDPAVHMADGAVAEMDSKLWDRILAVNLRGPMLCSKYAIPHMLKQGGGSIIFVTSGKGTQGDLGQSAYGASKAALINLAQNVATQYGKRGIRANALVVGLVMTDSLDQNMPSAIRTVIEAHHLTPHLGTPRQIADAAVFLASDESAFVTGHSLFADGGVTAHAAPVADFRKLMGDQH